jgi:hypothetical protein
MLFMSLRNCLVPRRITLYNQLALNMLYNIRGKTLLRKTASHRNHKQLEKTLISFAIVEISDTILKQS